MEASLTRAEGGARVCTMIRNTYRVASMRRKGLYLYNIQSKIIRIGFLGSPCVWFHI